MRTHTRFVLTFALALAAVLHLGVPAAASVARRVSLQELVQASTVIVLARCEHVESRWTPDRTQIVTTAVYRTAESYKGTPERQFKVAALGGGADGMGMYVPGMPSFAPGRDEVLFLEPLTADVFQVVGMAQGQFVVSTGDSSGRRVGRKMRGIELIGPADPNVEPRSFDAFRSTLRALVR
jgi:hypothetical protein